MHIGIWADGGPKLGFGHLVRTRTLARELLARGHRVTYLTQTPDHVAEVCSADSFRVDLLAEGTAESAVSGALEHGIDVLVVDRGQIPVEDQRTMRDALSLTLVLDADGGTVDCDLVVNGHIYARPEAYDWTGEEPTWCVGGDYLLFDAALRRFSRQEPAWNAPPRRALITMGGSDVGDTTPDAIYAFDGTAIAVDVIVGPGFQNRKAIDEAVAETDGSFDVAYDPDDLAARMFRADMAVTSLGLTAYELLATRTPFVGIAQAPDQRPKVRALQEQNAALVLDDSTAEDLSRAVSTLIEDDSIRRTLFERSRDIVGTDGTAAVADRVEALG